MLIKKDISDINDIRFFVNEFYDRVRADDLLGKIFNDRIGDHWQVHLEKMYGFWQSILFGERSYNGRPFPPHMGLPIGEDHFTRWVNLFEAVLNELFQGPVAEEAKLRAKTIAGIFLVKIQAIQSGDSYKI